MPDYKLILIERFMEKVEMVTESGCWIWMAALDPKGYGKVRHFREPRGWGMEFAHRIAYEIFRGEIPGGLPLDKLCRVRCCCNPWRTEAVTHGENIRRGVCWQREKTHCPQGHTYDYTYPNGRHRICMTCKNAHNVRYRLKKKAGVTSIVTPALLELTN